MRKITRWPSVLGVGLLAAASSLALAAGPAGAVVAAGPAPAAATPTVSETLIDPGSTSSYAAAINDRGDVVGTEDAGAFLRDASGVHVLAPPAGVEAILPMAINDRGDILTQTSFGPDQVYLWRDGRWIFIADGDAAGLNERGQVLVQVGAAAASFLLWQDGRSTAITAPDVTGVPSLTGGYLNQIGQVAFSSRDSDAPNPIEAWLWSGGHYTRLPALVRGASAQVEGLNDLGEVVGESGDAANPTEHVAVTWTHGAVHRLAAPPATSDLNDDAAAVNNRGQVVGTNDTPDTPPEQALLWPGTSAPAALLAPGYYSGARTINDAGQVLINALVATGLTGHNEALAERDGQLADLGAGTPIGQNVRGQIIVDINAGGTVQAALFTIDWGDLMTSSSHLTYGSYLRLDDLLDCQRPLTDVHDEMLFVVIHQVYELWFKQTLYETDLLQRRLEDGDGAGAVATARRIAKILKTVVGQMDVLETMTPQQFARFRPDLGSSSGFQSTQFRRIEAVYGRRHFSYTGGDPVLTEIMGRRPVFASLLRFLDTSGWPVPADVLDRDPRVAWPGDDRVLAALAQVYDDAGTPAEVCEALVDVDEGIQEWRYRHVKAVERIIGSQLGTGGSTGVDYLRGTLFHPFFPDLWQVRSQT